MEPKREQAQVSVVLLGAFNPQIFQPAWFALHELLPSDEAEAASIEVIHPEVVQFSTEWLEVQVTRDRFYAATSQEPAEPLRDLVVGTFSLLQYTPVRAMGINLDSHYAMGSEEPWHTLGHTLVPPENWVGLGKPGLISVTEQGVRGDEFEGFVRVKTEPSALVTYGVYVQVNDHYQWTPDDGDTSLPSVMGVLSEGWRGSLERAQTLTLAIIEIPHG